MPNISEINVQLVKAFNISVCYNNIADTNFSIQNLYDTNHKDYKDHIVILFCEDMGSKQCIKYLNTLKDKIVKTFYINERAASISYDLKSFPFNFKNGQLNDDKGRKKFLVTIDEGVVFNLKSYLAHALAKDVKENMGMKFGIKRCKDNALAVSFDKDYYLCGTYFYDIELQKYFVDSFSTEIEGYENAPRDFLEERGSNVYIKKSIFDNAEFIKDIMAYNASLICRDFQTPSTECKNVYKLKYAIINFMDKVAGIPVRSIVHTSYVANNENSIFIPLVQGGEFLYFLTEDDKDNLNCIFGKTVVTSIENHLLRNPYWGGNEVFAIDLSDVDVAYCIMDKIIESSVINEQHELSVDREHHFQSLLPLVSPEHKSKPELKSNYPAKEQNIIQKTWSRLSGKSSKGDSSIHSPSKNNIPWLSTAESTSLIHNENNYVEYISKKQHSFLNVPKTGYCSISSSEVSPPPQSRSIVSIEVTAGIQKFSNELIYEGIRK